MPNSYPLLKTIITLLYYAESLYLRRDELIEQIHNTEYSNLSIKTIDEYLDRLIIEGVVNVDTLNHYFLQQPSRNTIDIIIKG